MTIAVEFNYPSFRDASSHDLHHQQKINPCLEEAGKETRGEQYPSWRGTPRSIPEHPEHDLVGGELHGLKYIIVEKCTFAIRKIRTTKLPSFLYANET